MIHPNMATMLAFITTDAAITQDLLNKALKETVEDSYNMISVDGDTSTNDSVLVLANAQAENTTITQENEDYHTFKNALQYVNTYIAQQIIRDGEGATKYIEAQVSGVSNKENSIKLAKSIVTSNLVKTALFGEDANWGRILAAMGYSGADFNPASVNISFNSPAGSIALMENGKPLEFDDETATNILKERDINISVVLNEGNVESKAWGCDLSYEYVRINGEYRT